MRFNLSSSLWFICEEQGRMHQVSDKSQGTHLHYCNLPMFLRNVDQLYSAKMTMLGKTSNPYAFMACLFGLCLLEGIVPICLESRGISRVTQ